MGNSSTKESRPPSSRSRPSSLRQPSSGEAYISSGPQSPADRVLNNIYSSRGGRGSRPDLSFLHIGNPERDVNAPEPRKETKQEREARKLEKERVAREAEREKSLREEGVDGGYLVTLGTYTGPEDFNKGVVRQLMVSMRSDMLAIQRLTIARLNADWPPSGKDSMTTPTPGPSISLLQQSADYRSQPLMKSPLGWKDPNLRCQKTNDPLMPTSTNLHSPFLLVHSHISQTHPIYLPRIPHFPHLDQLHQPLPHLALCHSSVGEPRPLHH